jgi:uncharacterized SAM-binding protein YcdF (DUF218 family)
MEKSIIIVLGNFMDESGRLNLESSSRLDLAIDLFVNGKHDYIITCGWNYNSQYNFPIAESMKSYIIQNSNIDCKLIFTETNSRDTVGDAIFSKINVVNKKSVTNLLVVTSDYHILRTQKIFSFVYGKKYRVEVEGSKNTHIKDKALLEDESLKAFYETFKGIQTGNDDLILNRLCSNHPFYNGEIYDKFIQAG